MEATIKNLTSILINELKSNVHKVGFSDRVEGDQYESNYIYFEKDGFSVELSYRLCGKLRISNGDYWTPDYDDIVDVWGIVDELIAVHEDPETEEVTEFSEDDLQGLYSLILETIKNIIL